MRRKNYIRVTFEIEKPEGVTENDWVAWIRFQINDTSEIDNSNPLVNEYLDPVYVDIREV